MMYLSIFWDFFELKDRQISKATPSKAVIAMVNENLIKLRKNTPDDSTLISKLWLPKHLDIKGVVLDTDYCEKLRAKLRRLMEVVKGLELAMRF